MQLASAARTIRRDVIARHEYELYPNLPPGNFLRMQPRGEHLERYRLEIERCLQDEPSNGFCQRSRAALEAYRAP